MTGFIMNFILSDCRLLISALEIQIQVPKHSLWDGQICLEINREETSKIFAGPNIESRDRIQEYYQIETTKRPIRRGHIQSDEDRSRRTTLKEFMVNKSWDNETASKLVAIWEHYQSERESMFHDLISKWNSSRELFRDQNGLIPFMNVEISALDETIHARIQEIDHYLYLNFVTVSLLAMKMQKPCLWDRIYSNIVNGTRLKQVPQTDIDSTLIQAFFDSQGNISDLSKAQKMKIASSAGISLAALNLW